MDRIPLGHALFGIEFEIVVGAFVVDHGRKGGPPVRVATVLLQLLLGVVPIR